MGSILTGEKQIPHGLKAVRNDKTLFTSGAAPNSVRSDDAADVAGGGLRRLRRLGGQECPPHICVQNVEVLQAAAGVEQDDGIFGLEEAAGDEPAIGDEAGGAFGGGEDAFDFRPVASRVQDFFVGGADGDAVALL